MPAEVFNDAIRNDHFDGSRYEAFEAYWQVELAIADTAGLAYTDLQAHGQPEDRTCTICGTVYGTTEDGLLPQCSFQACASVREFWQYAPELHNPSRRTGVWRDDVRRTRVAWFTKAIRDKFGVKTVFQLEPAIRLDALISLRLMREAYEHQHEPCRAV